jgi:magnesium chelatase family protein
VLPPLGDEEVVAVTRIHSAAGTLRGTAPSRLPPFRSPHHTVTRAGLVGGGGNLRPGEVTLAHQGLLFLDELGEFSPAVLDVLREPLEEGRLAMVRGNGRHVYPADFQLLAAMNPCRCGFLGSRRRPCRCSPAALALYRGRLSGPLLDRIDLFVEMVESPPVLLQDGRAPSAGEGEGWPALLRRIRQARDLLRDRPDSMLDSDPETLARAWGLDGTALRCLEEARVGLGLSIRGVLRCARVARTAAALDGRAQVARADVLEALTFRLETLPGFAAEPSGHVP